MHNDLYSVRDDGTINLNVHAQPAAGRTHVAGTFGTALKIRVAVPPTQGKANEALARVLAESFDLAESAVTLESGASSRTKRFALKGLDTEVFEQRLDELITDAAAGPGPKRGRR